MHIFCETKNISLRNLGTIKPSEQSEERLLLTALVYFGGVQSADQLLD